MKFTTDLDFECPDAELKPHLEKIFLGEYDVRVSLPHGTTILDLGANFGAFSVWASHRWPGSTIHAYEPHPESFSILKRNLTNYPNVTPRQVGVGTPGMRILLDGRNNAGERSFHSNMVDSPGTGLHAEVINPLTLPEANVLKLDIEGCELEVLVPLIAEGRTYDLILLEWHSHHLRHEVDRLLKDYALIGSEVIDWRGRGIGKYLNLKHLRG